MGGVDEGQPLFLLLERLNDPRIQSFWRGMKLDDKMYGKFEGFPRKMLQCLGWWYVLTCD